MKQKSIVLFIFFFPVLLFAQSKKSPKDLAETYKKWIQEEVVYIITAKEKEVFLQFESDRERDVFIKAFWKHRDPTPGTPANEYKQEHYRRFNYANHYFGRTAPKPGWKTDRGRIYIILGEPADIEKHESHGKVYPSEVWFYQGDPSVGLPPQFQLIFFQKKGSGEYILYSPVRDGPESLIAGYLGDAMDRKIAYQQLLEYDPTLAPVTLSLIPGERPSLSADHPSLASDVLISRFPSIPHKKVEDKYAEQLLRYKDIVEVEYSVNYIDNFSLTKIYRGPSGIFFLYYVLQPKRLSIGIHEDKYYSHLKLNGNITDPKGQTIFQYEKSIPLELTGEQLSQIKSTPFNLYDMVPLTPGSYRFSVLLKNTVSKEFTSLEKEISIPYDLSSLHMTPLVIGYKTELLNRPVNKPFSFGNKIFYCLPEKNFVPSENLYLFFQVYGLTPELREKGVLKYTFFRGEEEFRTFTKEVKEYPENINFWEEFLLRDFIPAYYRIKVSFLDSEQKEVLSEIEEFFISSKSVVPRPWIHTRAMPNSEDPIYSYILGIQWFNKGEIEKARECLENAYQKDPESSDYAFNLARVLYLLKDFTKTKEILSPFLNKNQLNYEGYYLMGRVHQVLGELEKAISIYDAAISHFGININLLNSLGDCYHNLGNEKEALAAWEKSLEINPEQEKVRRLIESLNKQNK
jgi:GWxTD domain-containing protein